MRNPVFLAGLAIIFGALTILLLFGDGGTIAGMSSDNFARLAQLTAILLLVSGGVVASRAGPRTHLKSALFWIAVCAALVVGYQMFHADEGSLNIAPSSNAQNV
ncbi:hypothetical protein HDIA_2495 [Hartmannibacter diazotrophicus]|uniref:Uncharacterized protein n=1 Tax=Hartmannibacter diazotrophicus TaxID=1482074 RepID=A0A2C9D6X3_9HYPH|nr:hypothetical protein [Hartmannibacter diazotrophicus]SON56036.1 hypothetical protein HDIA_2495 [Hartmannibacter diazotrophicus]